MAKPRVTVLIALSLLLGLGALGYIHPVSKKPHESWLLDHYGLHSVVLALHSYHEEFGTLPAPAIYDGALSLTAWLSDGKTIVAGLAGAYLAVELVKIVLGIHVKTGDTFALPLALALAVGRWGCFLNGCCYGVETNVPWGVVFDVAGRPVCCHPTQIYESLFHLLMAGILLALLLWAVLPRHHLQIYLIAYGCYRFLSEFIRPEPVWWLGLTIFQWAALALAAAMVVQWIVEETEIRHREVMCTRQ